MSNEQLLDRFRCARVYFKGIGVKQLEERIRESISRTIEIINREYNAQQRDNEELRLKLKSAQNFIKQSDKRFYHEVYDSPEITESPLFRKYATAVAAFVELCIAHTLSQRETKTRNIKDYLTQLKEN